MKLIAQEETAIYKVVTQRPHVASRSLRSLGTWGGGGTPSKAVAAFWTGGTIPWVSPKDMKVARIRDAEDRITPDAVASSATSLVRAGAVVLVVRSGILKHSLPVAVTDVDVALNQDMKALQPAPGVEATYVAWALRANAQRILRTCTKAGTTVQSIEMPALFDFEIPLPPPEEQRRVVETVEARLSLLDASVAGLHRVQANLKRYRASVLKAACEGRLVPTEAEFARQEGRDFETGAQLLQHILAKRRALATGKYKEPAKSDTDSPETLPAGWVWASLDQLMRNITDGDHQAPPQTAEGVPFLVIGNVRNGQIDLEGTRFVGQKYFDSLDARRKPAYGDLLYTLVGSYGIAVPVDTNAPFCIQRHMAILRPHSLSPRLFLGLALNSEGVFKQATAIATGTAQMTVPLLGLRRIRVALPPLAEQHRIVAEADRRLSLIRVAEAQVAVNLARAQRLRQSILQAAFAMGASAGQ